LQALHSAPEEVSWSLSRPSRFKHQTPPPPKKKPLVADWKLGLVETRAGNSTVNENDSQLPMLGIET